jgi:hypothetical protein
MDVTEDNRASFVWNEFRRIMLADTVVEQLCARYSKAFLPFQCEVAPVIARQLGELIRSGMSASLVRVGNSEGNVLALTNGGPAHPSKLLHFNAELFDQNGITLSEDEAHEFSTSLRTAIASADFIGFRFCDNLLMASEWDLIADRIKSGAARAAAGVLYAREFLQDGLTNNLFHRTTITSAWIYLGLIRHLDEIMDAARAVIIISGRPELRNGFQRRLGDRLRSFISIPGEGFRPRRDTDSHYRGHFPCVLQSLEAADLRGTLVIVGAGLFGKVYCKAAKDSGAVAVDLGSGLDILAGLSTRPVHTKIDISASRWN